MIISVFRKIYFSFRLLVPVDQVVRPKFLICFCFFSVQVNDDFGHVRQSLSNLTEGLLRNISSLEFLQSMVGLRRLSNLYINCKLSK